MARIVDVEGIGENITDTIIFFSDGTLHYTLYGITTNAGTWEIKDGKLIKNTIGQGVYNYTFTDDDKTLTLESVTSGKIEIYTKQ